MTKSKARPFGPGDNQKYLATLLSILLSIFWLAVVGILAELVVHFALSKSVISQNTAITLEHILIHYYRLGVLIYSFSRGIFIFLCFHLQRYELREDQVFKRWGVFSNFEKGIPYSKITDAMIEQSFLERIIGYGHIGIQTAGSDGIEMTLIGLDDFKEKQQDIRNRLPKKTNDEDTLSRILKVLESIDSKMKG